MKQNKVVRAASPLDDPRAIDPRSYGLKEVAAVKAVCAGTATEHQQRLAMGFILTRVCRVDDEQFYPGPEGSRMTDYALGMRRVGTFIRSLLAADLKKFAEPGAAPREQG